MTGVTGRHGGWIVALVVLVVHSPGLWGGYHYDDDHSVVRNQALRDIRLIPTYFVDPGLFSADPGRGMYRPLLLTSYALNRALLGDEARAFLLVNLLLHALNASLVTAIAGRRLSAGGAIMAGLLFGLHPVVTEPVNYVSARSDSLVACCVLLTLWLATRPTGRRTSGVGPSAVWSSAVWSSVLWPSGMRHAMILGTGAVAALLSKSTAIAVAPLLGLSAWIRGEAHSWTALLRRYWMVLTLSGLYLLLIWSNGFLPQSFSRGAAGAGDRLLTQITGATRYLQTLIMPVALSPEPPHHLSTSLSVTVLGSMALLLSLGFLVVALCRRRLRAPLALALWFAFCLVPVSLAPLNVLINDRRLYLPMVGAAIALAALGPWIRRLQWRRVLVILGLCILSVHALQRSQIWAEDLSLWQDAVSTGPTMPRAQLYLGDAYAAATRVTGNPAQAEAARVAYERVLALQPRQQMLSAQAGNGLALIDLAEGATQRATQRLVKLVTDYPEFADAWVNLGNAYYTAALAGDYNALSHALAAYGRALALHPGRYEAHLNRGATLQMAGHLNDAEVSYRRALELMPTEATAALNLGGLHMTRARLSDDPAERVGEWEAAKAAFLIAARNGSLSAQAGIRAVEDSIAAGRVRLP